MRANLSRVAPEAAENGLRILPEPINPRDRSDYFHSRCEEAQEIIRDLGHPNIRMMSDLSHIAIRQGDILRNLEKCIDEIGHVQIAAVPSRPEPDEEELATDRILRHLLQLGYKGWIGAEYHPRSQTDQGPGWMQAFR